MPSAPPSSTLPRPAPCTLCGGGGEAWLTMPFDVKSDRETGFGRLHWCRTCGLGFPDRFPDAVALRENYDLERYYTQGASHIAPVDPGLADRILIKLAWLVDRGQALSPELIAAHLGAGGTVVDIGCGGGDFLAALTGAGFEAIGVEPDPKARAQAETTGATVHDGTAEALPEALAPASCDAVVMSHVLEHCADPVAAVGGAASVLRPGGLFICEVPNCGAVYFRDYDQISEMLDVPRHLAFFTRRSLAVVFERAGLEIEAWYFNGFTRHHSPGWRAWENGIHTRLMARGLRPRSARHSLARSLWTLARSAAARPERKYDCIGLVARKRRA